MRFYSLSLFLIGASLLLISARGQAEPPPGGNQKASWSATLHRDASQGRIQNLDFPNLTLPVILRKQGDQFRPLIEIHLFFDRPGWKLLVQGSPAKQVEQTNEYVIHAYLLSQISEIQLSATGPDEQKEQETIFLHAPEAQEFEVVQSLSSISVAAGLGLLAYKQSNFGVFSSQTGLFKFEYLSPNESAVWGLRGDAMMTVLTLRSEPLSINPQFLSGRAFVTRRLPLQEKTKWRHRAEVGGGLIGLFANGSSFGFSTLMAPTLGWSTQLFKTDRLSYEYRASFGALKGFSLTTQNISQIEASTLMILPSLRRERWTLSYQLAKFKSEYSSTTQDVEVSLLQLSYGTTF